MKYLCLVYYDENKMQQLTQQEWDSLNRECMDCVEGLTQGGHFLDGAPLLSTETATTLRMRDNKPLVTDGPFAETKEQLAGFYMLEARDMNEVLVLHAQPMQQRRDEACERRLANPTQRQRGHRNSELAGR